MLNTMTKSEKKYHDMRARSQRKDGNISETFVFFYHRSILHDETTG